MMARSTRKPKEKEYILIVRSLPHPKSLKPPQRSLPQNNYTSELNDYVSQSTRHGYISKTISTLNELEKPRRHYIEKLTQWRGITSY